jgi:hypothetical protein
MPFIIFPPLMKTNPTLPKHAFYCLLLAAATDLSYADGFTTVLNLPQDQVEVSGILGDSNIQYNFHPGGRAAARTWFGWPNGAEFVSENIEANLLGGELGSGVEFHPGSRLNVSSGTIGRSLIIRRQSSLVMTGGSVGDSAFFDLGSTIRISGGSLGNTVRVEAADLQFTGGVVGDDLNLRGSPPVLVNGARIGRRMTAEFGGHIKMMSGSFGGSLIKNQGRLEWTGGRGGAMQTQGTGIVEITGGEFRLNGQPTSGLPGGLAPGDIFTGTISDGSVFVWSSVAGENDTPQGDAIAPGTLVLHEVPLPPVSSTPMVVGTGSSVPPGARRGSTIVVENGGSLPEYFSATGATLTLNGGSIGEGLEIHESLVTANTGTIGGDIRLLGKSRLVVNGSNVGNSVLIAPGSLVDLRSGSMAGGIEVLQGGQMRMSGGNCGSIKLFGSDLEIRGGSTGTITCQGGRITMLQGSVAGLIAETGSEVATSGGQIGDNFLALGSKITFGGGTTCGIRGSIGSGTHLVLEDANIGNEWMVYGGNTLVMHAGAIGEDLTVFDGAKLHITGGTVGARFSSSGEVVVSGGSLTSPFYIGGGSLNLRGTAFALDGAELTADLPLGVPFTIPLRNVTLSGILQDGTPFSFVLNDGPNDADGDGVFDTYVLADDQVTLTVTRVESPAEIIARESQAAGFSGEDTLPGAIPFGDGVSNLLKHAFNLPVEERGGPVMVAGGSEGLPLVSIERIEERVRVRVEYLRRADGSVIYRPRRSPDLAPGTWSAPVATRLVMPAAAGWERVRLEEWLDPETTPRQFYRVEVEIP